MYSTTQGKSVTPCLTKQTCDCLPDQHNTHMCTDKTSWLSICSSQPMTCWCWYTSTSLVKGEVQFEIHVANVVQPVVRRSL